MDTQKIQKVGYSKALIALTAAVSCFLIYVLACVLSPVTWSPDSSKIAILVTPPGDDPDVFAIFTYDIAAGERVLLDEVKADGILSAPAWSPDGKWIAYYKVDPSPPEEPESSPQADPYPNASTAKPAQKASIKKPVIKVKEQAREKAVAEELFSEEHKMLTPFLLEIVKEKLAEEEDPETFDVQLIVIRPDAQGRKVLRVMKWQGDENARKQMVFIRPQWSPDSGSIFYARGLDNTELYYISSLDLTTDKTQAHLFSSTGNAAVSHDGKWVASLLKEATLVVARTDGNSEKHFKVDMPKDVNIPSILLLTWSHDSKHILGTAEGEFWVVNAETGKRQKYSDPKTESVGYPVFSPVGNKVFYLAGYESADPNTPEEIFSLQCMNLEDGKTETVFQLSNFPETSDCGIFSISPDGNMVLLRCAIEDESGNKRSALIFWDGKTRKIVETEPWLIKPLFSDEDVTFEEKLIGKWKGKEGEMLLVSEGVQEKTYKMTLIDIDGEKETGTANLFRLKGMMFMGIFLDESVLQKKDSYGSHLLPDGFMKIDQIEPKLLLREMDYDELAEMLKMDPECLKQEATKVGYTIEAIRVQPKDSNAPAERN